MSQRTVSTAIVSTDPALRATFQAAVLERRNSLSLEAEITVPLDRIGTEQLAVLRQAEPELILLDLDEHPSLAINLAHALIEADPGRRIMASGSVLAPDLLLEAMRASISEFLPKPVDPVALRAALQRLEQQRHRPAKATPRRPGELITVFSPKGGSGSTTVATNLAIHLHQVTGKRTLLMDLDLELGEAAVLLGVQPRFSLIDLIQNLHRMDVELLGSYVERHRSGVHLLPAPFHPGQNAAVTGESVREALQLLRQHYDFVVVDTPKSLAPATLASMEHADQVVLLTTVDIPSLRNVRRCMPLLDEMARGGSATLRLVVNRHLSGSVISLEEVERTLGMSVYHTLSNDYAAVIHSINTGEPVVTDPRSSFARDLASLGNTMIGVRPSVAPGRDPLRKVRGLINPLRSLIPGALSSEGAEALGNG